MFRHLVRQTFRPPAGTLQGVSLPPCWEVAGRHILLLLLLLVPDVKDLLVVNELLVQDIRHTTTGGAHQLHSLLVQFPGYIDTSKPEQM